MNCGNRRTVWWIDRQTERERGRLACKNTIKPIRRAMIDGIQRFAICDAVEGVVWADYMWRKCGVAMGIPPLRRKGGPVRMLYAGAREKEPSG